MNWVSDSNGVCLFMEVTDAQLERIRREPKFYKDEAFFVECESSSGENAHIVKLFSRDNNSWILRELRSGLNRYKTVSWWSKNFRKFVIRRGSCHKQFHTL